MALHYQVHRKWGNSHPLKFPVNGISCLQGQIVCPNPTPTQVPPILTFCYLLAMSPHTMLDLHTRKVKNMGKIMLYASWWNPSVLCIWYMALIYSPKNRPNDTIRGHLALHKQYTPTYITHAHTNTFAGETVDRKKSVTLMVLKNTGVDGWASPTWSPSSLVSFFNPIHPLQSCSSTFFSDYSSTFFSACSSTLSNHLRNIK